MINYCISCKEVVAMKKPEKLGLKLVFLAVFILLLLIWYLLELPCIPRLLTGIPCPTCGLTRAWLAAFQLDFADAFWQYPMFWSIPLLVLYLLFDGRLSRNKCINNWLLGLMIAGIFLIWIARIFGFLGALSPL